MKRIASTSNARNCLGYEHSCQKDGKAKRKADLVELALNAHTMKLAKVSDGESVDTNALIAAHNTPPLVLYLQAYPGY